MPETGERLVVQLEARVADFERKMKKAERTGTRSYKRLSKGSRSATRMMETDMMRSTANINRALAASTVKIGAFGKAMAGGLAVGVVSAGLSTLTGNLADTVKGIASVGDEAKRSGLALVAFQEWKFVAEQNRISVDSLVDGFKELNLRADEFLVTGKGPAAEAFKRLGFNARDLKRSLEDPSELMLEIIGRMESLDRAAQIRVADEVFGGTAGERFVELLGRGEQGLRRTVQRAHEVGAVMDEEMIARADELDRKFSQLQTRLGNFTKGIAVAVAETYAGPDIEQALNGSSRAVAVLGQTVVDEFGSSREMVEQHADAIQGLAVTYRDLETDVLAASRAIAQEVPTLLDLGETDMALELAEIADQMVALVGEFQNGQVPAQEFEDDITQLVTRAGEAFEALEDIDGVSFDFVTSSIGRITGALSSAIERASELRSTLPGALADEIGQTGPSRRLGPRRKSDLAPTTSPRPRPAPALLGEPEIPQSSSGGGRSQSESDLAREIARIKEKTAALNAEAVALVAAARSGNQYGDAIEYARTKAELLAAAQKEGKEITPELRAEVDELARAYAEAGDAAETAAGDLNKIEEEAQRGADALTDVFFSVIEGSKSAKEAVADLLLEIAKAQFQSAILGLNSEFGGSGGGPLALLGGLLSFDGGGDTGNGPRSGGLDGKGGFLAMMHPQETVTDHTKGGQAGGTVSVTNTFNMDAPSGGTDVNQIRNEIRAMLPEINKSSVAAVAQARRRGVPV